MGYHGTRNHHIPTSGPATNLSTPPLSSELRRQHIDATAIEQPEEINPGVGWSDLDCFLFEFWDSYSICPNVMVPCAKGETRDRASCPLPEVEKRGFVDPVEESSGS